MQRSLGNRQFCTVALARLRRQGDGFDVTVSLGGHPPAWILRADARVSELGRHGTLLGSFPDPPLHEASTHLAPGDALLLYTDGLASGDFQDLYAIPADPGSPLRRWPDVGLGELLDGLVAYARAPAGGALRDDVALLALAARRP